MRATNSNIELVNQNQPVEDVRPMLWEMDAEERKRRLAELKEELTDANDYDS